MSYAIHTRGGSLIAGGFDTLSEAITSAKHYDEAGAIVHVREDRVCTLDRQTGVWANSAAYPPDVRFWFAPNGFENTPHPCLCVDDPLGGDPKILGLFSVLYRPQDIDGVCAMANRWMDATLALEWIAKHDNAFLTDGSAATRACIDAIVERAKEALSSVTPPSTDGALGRHERSASTEPNPKEQRQGKEG